MEIVTSLLDLGNNLLVAGDSNGVIQVYCINIISIGVELHEWLDGE